MLTTAPFQVMNLVHPALMTRDAALFLSFRRTLAVQPNVRVPLKTLVKRFMGRDIEENGDIPVSCALRSERHNAPDTVSSRWSGLGPLWISSVPASRFGRASLPQGRGRAPYLQSSIAPTLHDHHSLPPRFPSLTPPAIPHSLMQYRPHGSEARCTTLIPTDADVDGVASWPCITTSV